MIVSEAARRAGTWLTNAGRFPPTLWVGASPHHLACPGTVSRSNELYVKVIEDLLESLILGGFRRIFLLNGHGGNITPARQALYNVQLRRKDDPKLFLAFSSWWALAADQVAAIPDLRALMVTHACE